MINTRGSATVSPFPRKPNLPSLRPFHHARAALYRLSASHLRVELAERLFPDGVDQPPRLSQALDQGHTLNVLAQGYQLSGQPGAAVSVFRRFCELGEREDDQSERCVGLCNLSFAQRVSGDVRRAEASACTALRSCRTIDDDFLRGVSLYLLGLALAVRSHSFNGKPQASESASHDNADACGLPLNKAADAALHRSLQIWQHENHEQGEGHVNSHLAEAALWRGDPESARAQADRAWELAAVKRLERDFIRAARLQGMAAVRCLAMQVGEKLSRRALAPGSDHLPQEPAASAVRLNETSYGFAHKRLHHALTRARACQFVEEELPTLIALAELHVGKAKGGRVKVEADGGGREDDPVVGRSPDRLTGTTEGLPSTSPNDSGTQDNNDGRPAVGHVVGSGDPATTTAQDAAFGSPVTSSSPPAPEVTSLDQTPQQHLAQARELLDDVWDRAEAGPYPMFHADALNMLAAIERVQADDLSLQLEGIDHRAAAIAAAGQAYEKAWLQGPPFAYAYGLGRASEHLEALGVEPPELPPYDESLYEPMPDVDIDPEAESSPP